MLVHSCSVFVVDNDASKASYIKHNPDFVQNGAYACDTNSIKNAQAYPPNMNACILLLLGVRARQ